MEPKTWDEQIADLVAALDKDLAAAEKKCLDGFQALGFEAKVKVRRGQLTYGAKVKKMEAPKA